jgi:serine/threonine protein kinase
MGPGRPKSTPFSTPREAPEEEGQLTSEEIFGDLVDQNLDGEPRREVRKGPIRVKVREPGPDNPQAGDVLPADVAALLDAFSGPGEAASRPETSKGTGDAFVDSIAPPGQAGAEAEDLLDKLDLAPSEDAELSEPEIPLEEDPPAAPEGIDALLEGHEAAAPEDVHGLDQGWDPPEDELPSLAFPDELPSRGAPTLGGPLEDPPEDAIEALAPAEPDLPDLLEDLDDEGEDRSHDELQALADDLPSLPDPVDGDGSVLVEPPESPMGTARPARNQNLLEKSTGDATLSFDGLDALGFEPVDEEWPGAEPEAPRSEDKKPVTPPGRGAGTPVPKLPGRAAPGEVEDLLRGLGSGGEARPPLPPPKRAPEPQAEESLDLAALAETAIGADVRVEPVSREYGPYRLLEKIAVGGMAEVFRAKRAGVEGFEKVVAVKRILPHLSDNKEFVDMFINEAKMVAGLTHPNIVQIFDLGKIDKSYYIAMEYVHGKDLRSIQKRARDRELKIPLDISSLIVSKICLALESAHRKKDESGRPMRIVHRDVSPQNVLISYEGEVKLTDFGIAKAATKAPTTDSGALRGKLLYMSPEQAWGRPIDRRSDLFSLGIILYEFITEQKPFLGSSEVSILELVRECRIAPPRTINPRIPEKLETVVMKALAREPDERYQDASEMFRDLERALPEGKSAGGSELARFMEILFEPEQRSGPVVEDPPVLSGPLEMEFDAPTAENPPTKAAPRPDSRPDSMSIEKLLARFGIK